MKNALLILIFFINSINSYSQTASTFQCVRYENVVVINMTLDNLYNIEQISNHDFIDQLHSLGYVAMPDEDGCYLDNNGPAGFPYFVACKYPGMASFMWTAKNPMTIDLKDELEKYFVGYENGKAVYKIKTSERNYAVYLDLKDDGSGSVTIKKLLPNN